MTQAMRHPDIPEYPDGYPVAVNEAQARLMEGAGWVRVEEGRVDYSKMRKGQLLDAAEASGLEVPDKPTVPQLRALLEADQEQRLAALNQTPGVSAAADEED